MKIFTFGRKGKEIEKLTEQLKELDCIVKLLIKRDLEFTETRERLQKELVEIDKIAKMLIRKDFELSQSKEKLIEEKRKIDAVISNLIDGLIMVDQEQKIILINPKAIAILDVEKKELLGTSLFKLMRFTHIKKLCHVLGDHIEWINKQYELILGKQPKKFFQVRTTPVVAQNQEIFGLMIILCDVTYEKEAEQIIKQKTEELKKKVNELERFSKLTIDREIKMIELKEEIKKLKNK